MTDHPLFPERLDGLTVLEFGTLWGRYAVDMKERGAARVVACDSYYRKEVAARFLENDIEYWTSGFDDLNYPLRVPEQFDVVLFMNILYHLKNPVQGLETARNCCKPGGLVIVETAASQGESANITPPALWLPDPSNPWAGDLTNRFMPNIPCMTTLCGMAGLSVERTHCFNAGRDPVHEPRLALACRRVPGWKAFDSNELL